MKNQTKTAIVMLFIISIALMAIALYLFNNLNETVVLVVISICVTGMLVTFFIWKEKSHSLDRIKVIELESKRVVKNKATRNIINIIFLVIMAGVFYFIFYSKINNFYVFIYVVVHIVLSIVFIIPKKLVIDNNAIHCFPNWKVKWAELKAYQLDKNEGILTLEKVDGQTIQVKGIKEEDIEVIRTMIKKYNHEKTN